MLASRKFTSFFHILVFISFLYLGYLFYAPTKFNTTFTYFGTSEDPFIYIWFLNWWSFAYLHHLPMMHTDFVDAPVGMALAWKTSVPSLGLLVAPLIPIFGALSIYNALMLAAPGLAAWGGYLAAFAVTEDVMASLVGGLVFGFSGYMLSQLIDHLNLSFIIAVPLCLWACLAAAKRRWGHWRLALPLGFALAFEFGVSQEIFASTVTIGLMVFALMFTIDPARRPILIAILPGIGLGLAVSVLIISPMIWEMIRWYGDSGHVGAPPAKFSADLLGLVIPTPIDALGGQWFEPITLRFKGNYSEEGCYIGLPLMLLMAKVSWDRRGDPAFLVPACAAALVCVLSLGPYLHICGFPVSTAPWLIMAQLPFLKSMLPVRFMLYAWLAIAMFLAVWLAAPGLRWRRYATLALCLAFLTPARSYDRNWTHLPVPALLTDGTIAAGRQVLILPEHRHEIWFQYASGLRFSLVGQGYLGNGDPQPFAAWPIYESLVYNKFEQIAPKMLADYLAEYRVQDVVVTGDFADRRQTEPDSIAAIALLRAAGWRIARADGDAVLLRPQSPQNTPDAADLAADMAVLAPEKREHQVRAEAYWVCGIRMLAHLTGVQEASLMTLYDAHMRPPFPPSTIGCKTR